MQRLPILLILLPFTFLSSYAQEVDFEIPTEINIIQGRLAVAFTDQITEDEANKMISDMGYNVLQTNFASRTAYALSEKQLTEEETNKIEKDSRVVSIAQSELPRDIKSTKASETKLRYRIEVSFLNSVTETEARNILSDQKTAAFHIKKKPANELVIEVGDQDEAAFAALQERQEVKWVTYVGIAEGN